MYANEKRKSCGTFKPNLYCLLQIMVLALSITIMLQFANVLNVGIFIYFIAGFISI